MQPASVPFTGYQKFVVAILALLQFTIILDFMVLAPLGDVLMKSLAIGPAQFSLVVSAYAFSAGLSGLLAAGFADRFDRKRLLVFFYAGFTVGTLACALAGSYQLLLLARVVTGLFGGVIGSIVLAIVTDEFGERQRGRVMGLVQLAFAASQVLGIPLSLWLSTRWNWHAPFALLVALALLVGGALMGWLRPVTGHLALQARTNALTHLWHTLRRPAYQTGLLAAAFLTAGGGLLLPFSSAFLINNVQLTQAQLPIVYLVTGLSSLLVIPLVGRLSDRVSRFNLFAAGSALAIVMVLVYTHLGPTPLWQVVVVNVVLFMGIMSRMVPAMALNTSVPELADRGAYLSITSSVQQLASGMAAVCAGLVVTQATKSAPLVHFQVLGYVAATVFLVCALLLYRVSLLVARKPVSAAPVAGVTEALAITLAE